VTEIIDAAVFANMKRNDVLFEYIPEPLKRKFLPGTARGFYPAPTGIAPFGEFTRDALPEDAGPMELPGSNPAITRAKLTEMGIDRAVLTPITRGLLPSTNTMGVVCNATNRWLAETWLESGNTDGFFSGSITVDPRDTEAAIAEIDLWADRPDMAQVVVPLQVHVPYGQRIYWPLWEAAAKRGLPIAVRADGGAGVEFPPTGTGFPRTFIEFSSLLPLIFVHHLSSLIAEGTFEKFPELKFVFVDGGHDVVRSLTWTLDTTYPTCRGETPWVKRMPSEYLADHVRFITSDLEKSNLEGDELADWYRITDAADLLMYGSRYPHWTSMPPEDVLPGQADGDRARVLAGNARSFYGERLANRTELSRPPAG
jgi:uncharacterized protein